MFKIGIAVCTLNQLSLDFEGNCERILKSIHEAVKFGALIRIGPELEISGYGCEDAFFEADTTLHSWQVVSKIIQADFKNILIDLGMPVLKNDSLYNCRVVLLNSKIVLIRPKMKLANSGNYREGRWFTPWGIDTDFDDRVVWFQLPSFIASQTGQSFVPFGADVVLDVTLGGINLSPFRIGFEICEELWSPKSSHIKLFQERGCHLICNGSASYWEIRKLDKALHLMQTATAKSGGVYAFSNLLGCDGGRVCFYGRSIIFKNGDIITMSTSKQRPFNEVDVAVAYIHPFDVSSYRQQFSLKTNSHLNFGTTLVFNPNSGFEKNRFLRDMKTLTIDISGLELAKKFEVQKQNLNFIELKAEQEILLYGSLWLWDYLKRSSLRGYVVPLSGGIDSSAVSILVYCMCVFLWNQISDPFIRKRIDYLCKNELINGPKDICKHVLRCCYLSTKYSGKDSLQRATSLTTLIGADFCKVDFNNIYEEIQKKTASCDRNDGDNSLRQQNLQARLRMVLTYHLSEGNKLVLGAGNVDEALVGYLTKYDCSSADLNPIGSISKQDLREFVRYFKDNFVNGDEKTVIGAILDAIPSAELTGEEQKDEDDIGLTYDELSIFGRVRRGDLGCFGPYGLFCKLWEQICNETTCNNLPNIRNVDVLSTKVKRFFTLHARNRHKQVILTPALHAETYSPDDNRFDHRQFLFNSNWNWQFKCIDDEVAKIKSQSNQS